MKTLCAALLMLCFAPLASAKQNDPQRLKQLIYGKLATAPHYQKHALCMQPGHAKINRLYVKGKKPASFKMFVDLYDGTATFKPRGPRGKKPYVRLTKVSFKIQRSKLGTLFRQDDVWLETNQKLYSRDKDHYRIEVVANARAGTMVRMGQDLLRVDRRDRRVPKGSIMVQEIDSWSNNSNGRQSWKTSRTFLAPQFIGNL